MTGCTSFKRLERLGSEEKAGQNTRCSLNPQNRASVPLLVLLQKEKAVKRSKRKGEWENEGRGWPSTNCTVKYQMTKREYWIFFFSLKFCPLP